MSDERIIALEAACLTYDARLQEGDTAIQHIKRDLAENTEATKRIDLATSDIVEFFESMKGAFKVLNWIGKLARPIGAIIGLCVALWGAWVAWRTGVHR